MVFLKLSVYPIDVDCNNVIARIHNSFAEHISVKLQLIINVRAGEIIIIFLTILI